MISHSNDTYQQKLNLSLTARYTLIYYQHSIFLFVQNKDFTNLKVGLNNIVDFVTLA